MEVDLPLTDVPAYARRVEAMGYDGLSVPEAIHSGILVAALALEHTRTLSVSTGVVVAFARSPMLLAQEAWDLQRFSKGRFELGLGSQVKGNITRRFGMPWAAPAPRMREFVAALRAIFQCWQEDTELRFEGEHYQITRMQPFFKPGKIEEGPIPILLGGVKRAMVALAGEVGDAHMTHPTNSDPRYLREVVVPAIEAGAQRIDRDRASCALMASPFIATGATSVHVRETREKIRQTLAFLYSTPAYRPTLDLHGWAELGQELHRLSLEGAWQDMTPLITDELLEALVPTAPYDEIADLLRERYGGIVDRITFPVPADPSFDDAACAAIRALRTA